MPVDWSTGVQESSMLHAEEMACALPRVPLVAPGTESAELRPLYEEAVRLWGHVPRYLQLMAHVPAGVEAWNLLDRELRMSHLATDPGYVRLQELIAIKTSFLNICNN